MMTRCIVWHRRARRDSGKCRVFVGWRAHSLRRSRACTHRRKNSSAAQSSLGMGREAAPSQAGGFEGAQRRLDRLISATDMADDGPAWATLWSSIMLDTAAPWASRKSPDSVSSPRKLRARKGGGGGAPGTRWRPGVVQAPRGPARWGRRCAHRAAHSMRNARLVFSTLAPGRARSHASLVAAASVVMSPADRTPALRSLRPSLQNHGQGTAGMRGWRAREGRARAGWRRGDVPGALQRGPCPLGTIKGAGATRARRAGGGGRPCGLTRTSRVGRPPWRTAWPR